MKNALLVIFLFAFCSCHKSGTTCIVCKTDKAMWNDMHTSFYEQQIKDTSLCNIDANSSIIGDYIDSNTKGRPGAQYAISTQCN